MNYISFGVLYSFLHNRDPSRCTPVIESCLLAHIQFRRMPTLNFAIVTWEASYFEYTCLSSLPSPSPPCLFVEGIWDSLKWRFNKKPGKKACVALRELLKLSVVVVKITYSIKLTLEHYGLELHGSIFIHRFFSIKTLENLSEICDKLKKCIFHLPLL